MYRLTITSRSLSPARDNCAHTCQIVKNDMPMSGQTNTIDSRSPQMSDCFRKIESGGTASTQIYELIELTLNIQG